MCCPFLSHARLQYAYRVKGFHLVYNPPCQSWLTVYDIQYKILGNLNRGQLFASNNFILGNKLLNVHSLKNQQISLKKIDSAPLLPLWV